ncbi:hypothetical protein TELCIR_05746 [Teladorsagia circumcincta]|uniref:Uncharacterized protein n=1 Tax=Teladorsagia circumcincta TaxID=45464 RepID=A0A2G9URL7_TELCI|nr:hypothetical protein TELCIR_05746 [Teladorsagia circumcincta]
MEHLPGMAPHQATAPHQAMAPHQETVQRMPPQLLPLLFPLPRPYHQSTPPLLLTLHKW